MTKALFVALDLPPSPCNTGAPLTSLPPSTAIATISPTPQTTSIPAALVYDSSCLLQHGLLAACGTAVSASVGSNSVANRAQTTRRSVRLSVGCVGE